MAEMIPSEPEPDNAGAGKGAGIMYCTSDALESLETYGDSYGSIFF